MAHQGNPLPRRLSLAHGASPDLLRQELHRLITSLEQHVLVGKQQSLSASSTRDRHTSYRGLAPSKNTIESRVEGNVSSSTSSAALISGHGSEVSGSKASFFPPKRGTSKRKCNIGDMAADSTTAARMRSQLLLPLLPLPALHVSSTLREPPPSKPLHPIYGGMAGDRAAAGSEITGRAAALASVAAAASQAPARRFGTSIRPVAISLAECQAPSRQRWAHLEELYAVDQEIGRGHFGVVRVCVERETGSLYACKSIAITNIKVGGGW